jgi:hypothetical protein
VTKRGKGGRKSPSFFSVFRGYAASRLPQCEDLWASALLYEGRFLWQDPISTARAQIVAPVMLGNNFFACVFWRSFIAARRVAASANLAETTTWPRASFGKRRSNANGSRSRYNRPSSRFRRRPRSARRGFASNRSAASTVWLLPMPKPPPTRPNASPSQSEHGERAKGPTAKKKAPGPQ